MKRKISFLILYGTLIFFGGLGALVLLFGERSPHASETENRMLAGFPTLSWETVKDGSFMSGLESFLSDNIPDRDRWVVKADRIMDRLSLGADDEDGRDELYEQVAAFGQMAEATADPEATGPAWTPTAGPTPRITTAPVSTGDVVQPEPSDAPAAGPTATPTAEPVPEASAVPEKDLSAVQTCFFTYTRNDGSSQVVYTFLPEDIRRMIRTLNAYRAVLPKDGHVFFAQPPFPSVAGALQSGQYAGWGGELENTINEYSNDGVYMVSVQKVLEQGLLDGEYLYFTTDHHWTPRAACYTANAILKTMGIDPKPYDSYSFQIHTDFYGSAASNNPAFRSAHKPDTLEVMVPITPVKGYRIYWDGREEEAPLINNGFSNYMIFLGGTLGPWRRFETGVDCGRSCLVIGDSFANAFIPFLTPYYETVHVTDVRADYYDGLHATWTISQYIRKNGIDDVYFILSTANGVNTVYLIETLQACL